MECSNSGKPLDLCTCGYCVSTNECADFCDLPVCPFVIKEQCPVKRTWDKIGIVEQIIPNKFSIN